jgi:CRP-like cAMP-binding protein
VRRLLTGRRPLPPRVPPPNALLAALSDRECLRLLPSLRLVSIKSRRVLQRQGEPVRAVYFPNSGMASIIAEMPNGRSVEVTSVGREGLIGLSAYFSGAHEAAESIVQAASGTAERMAIGVFRQEMTRGGALHQIVNDYTRRFMHQVMQSAGCHGLHTVEQRCCRWLLLAHDRNGRDDLRLTQDFLAALLGVRRATVSVVLGRLHRRGILDVRSRRIRILHRRRLEAMACECYGILRGLLRLPGAV